MAEEILKRDGNHVTVLGGVTDNVAQEVTMLRVDPITKRLKVSALGSAGIASINGDTTSAQILNVGTTGNDFNIDDDSAGTHTFNLPDASSSARGVVTTSTQEFAGVKTFNEIPILPATTPTLANQAVTKNYVDTFSQGLSVRQSCDIATTANITLSGEQTIDGIATSASRVLVKNQSTGANNGIYTSGAGAWTRTTDYDTSGEVQAGTFTAIIQGTTQANTLWVQTTQNPTLGSSSLVFTQLAGAIVSGIGGSTGATDNRLLRSDGTGGSTLQNSAISVDDSGNTSGMGTLASGAITVTNSLTTPGVKVIQNGNTGATLGSSGAILIDNTNNTGMAMQIYSNQASPVGFGSLLYVNAANASWNQPLVYIVDNSTSGAAANIRIDSPNPDIELIETDQVSPAGKFEIAVQGDKFQINGRNAADNSFEQILNIARVANGGMMGLGVASGDVPNAMLEIVKTSGKAYFMLSGSVGASSGSIASVNEVGVLSVGAWTTATTATGKIQLNSNATSPSTIDLSNTIAVGTGTGGANATNKYLGQFGFLSRDSSFTAPKLVAYIGAEATESYAADVDTGSDIVFYAGKINGTNPVEMFRMGETGFTIQGSTSGSTILKATAVASGTLTLPAATDTLVGKATTDTLTNKTLTTPTITKPILNATNPTAQTYTPAGGATATLDLSLANQNYITMPAGNITIALSNDTNNQVFLVSITQDAIGSRTVTWFSTIRWATGTVPTLTTTANKRDVFGFIRTGTGTYDGFIIGQNI